MLAAVEEAAGSLLADAIEIGLVVDVAALIGEIFQSEDPTVVEPFRRLDVSCPALDVLAGRPLAPLKP